MFLNNWIYETNETVIQKIKIKGNQVTKRHGRALKAYY